ncbi:hypothetical protein AVEN_208954-1 [Araneus ventricosus]|uniref:Uncharacterized protein n=1 Tax=Araneus ventricosus TaxID=182803 RepID=A0A4Y2GCM0_ARAVE|nr:hypothetical protein AVEN_208954-1 [Araneus ventricosus]
MSLSKFVLRSVNHCPIFNENPKDFDEVNLPTKKDVLLSCLEVRRQVGLESESNKEPVFFTVARQVAIKLNIIWDKASIPTVTHNRVIQLIIRCRDDYLSIKKTLNCKTTVRKTKDESLIEQTSKLFDIAFCKCADFSGCTCPKNKKVPVLERQFLLDQRGQRIGRIRSVDFPVTKGMIKRAERSCKRLRPEIFLSESSYSNADSHSLSDDSQHFGDGDDVAGVENKAEDNFVKGDMFTKPRGKTSKPKLDLTETVIIAQRYNVSERAVAHITSAVLHAALKAGIMSSRQSSNIISALIVDKNRIRREKLKVARNLKQRPTDDDPIKSLYFDGRKVETKTQTGIVIEKYISLVSEPN